MRPSAGLIRLGLGLCILGVGAWLLWYGRRSGPAGGGVKTDEDASALLRLPPGMQDDPVIAEALSDLEAKPDDARRWIDLAEVLLRRAEEGAETDLLDSVEAALQRALALHPADPLASSGMARVHAARHDFGRSLPWAQKAIELDPGSAPAHGVLLDAALARGDYASAREHSQRLLDIAPDVGSYTRAARILYLTGDFRKSIWMVQKALELAPPGSSQAAACRAQLAMLYWQSGALLPAEQTAQAGLAQSPEHRDLLLAMGKVKAGRKDYAGAIECCRKAVSRRPDPEAMAELGDLLLASGQAAEAESLYRQVEDDLRRRASRDRLASLETARFLADHDRDLARALRLAEEACAEFQSPFALDTLAWCYYKNERYQEAVEKIGRALQKRTQDANIFFHAGMISWKLGRRPLAQQYLYQALSLNPCFHPLHAELAAETLKKLAASPGVSPEPSSAGPDGAALRG